MIRIYEYGLLPPTLNEQLVEDQMRAGHRYRNALVEIERERRERVAAVMTGHVDTEPLADEIATLSEERERLRLQIRKHRATTRSRSEAAEDRARVRDLGARLKDLRAQLRAAKATIAADPEIQAKLAEIEKWSRNRVKEERARCGAYWGTYLLAEAAADQARKSKTPPRFARWTGEGRVSVQLQGGMEIDELATDTRLQIHMASDHRTGRRAGTRRKLRLRIGSDGRAPIWAEWPMIMHRPLPEGSRIKTATVQRRRRDCRTWDWRVQILVDIPDGSARSAPDGGAVALNLGWAQVEGGIRAGYVRGTDGRAREVVLPRSIIDRIEKSESIRSIRDRALDAMQPALIEAIGAIAGPPQDLVERCEHMHAWRSPARFAALARWWRERRFDGDAEAYDILESWRYRDEHLQRYEAGLLRGALGHRREVYRTLAAELARTYRMLVVDDTDLRAMQRSPAPESERTEIDVAKRNQRHAAGSELRAALVSAFGERRTVVLPAQDVTRRCHECGSIEQWDRAASGRLHTCSQCGVQWDQDDNACRNLLREWSRAADEWEAARARKAAERKESRSERLRRARKKAA
jgi:hypothetical protein